MIKHRIDMEKMKVKDGKISVIPLIIPFTPDFSSPFFISSLFGQVQLNIFIGIAVVLLLLTIFFYNASTLGS